MNALRSIIFNLFYIFGSLILSLLLMWTFVFPTKKCAELVGAIYGGYISLIEKYILGLRCEFIGWENLPTDTPYIIAAKHQSAFETLKIPFMKSLRNPVIILKKELTYLPLWGFYPGRMGLVAIDRKQGASAMRAMSDGCKKAIADGRAVAIFPQGTRVKPGARAEYKTGLAKIYRDLQVPVVPLALNSGVFWGKNKFFKKSGTVTMQFLPAIPAGLPPLQVMAQLEEQIEAASDKLVQAAGGPALPPPETHAAPAATQDAVTAPSAT